MKNFINISELSKEELRTIIDKAKALTSAVLIAVPTTFFHYLGV